MIDREALGIAARRAKSLKWFRWDESWYHDCLDWRQKLTMSVMGFTMAWYHVLEELASEDKISWETFDKLDPFDRRDRWLAPICERIGGHVVEDDQCSRPEHRYCLACDKRCADQPVSIVVPQAYLDAWNAKLEKLKESK